jgi:hypothetical protein
VFLRVAKWIAGRILRLVPERVLGRVLPGAFRFDAGQVPPPPRTPDTRIRLYIAPVNYAGQGWQWARAAERGIEGVGAINMVVRTAADFRHPADDVVPLGYYAASRRWQRERFEAVASGYTHVIIESERQPFGAVLDETVESQVSRLRDRGVEVIMLCHGSDIRLPSAHLTSEPESPFDGPMAGSARALERIARDNRRMLARLGLPILVSTPGNLDVPGSVWLPVVVEREIWGGGPPALRGSRPLVAHAPSSGALKGSDLVDPIAQRLHDEGVIEYRRITAVPFEEMPDAYRAADIVLDQFRLGDYGVAACEAMAAGRLVIGHVSPAVRDAVESATGSALPILEASARDLEALLRQVAAAPETYRTIAEDGRRFVGVVHDGSASARVLAPLLRRER